MKISARLFLSRLCLVLLGTIWLALQTGSQSSAQLQQSPNPEQKPGDNTVLVLSLNDTMISPMTENYLQQGLSKAAAEHASALVLELDTPGGFLSSTHRMVKSILNAPVPVIVYVSPNGARAGSAGVFITMAAHVAAMAPSTHLGAAHPVDENGQWPSQSKQVSPPNNEEAPSKYQPKQDAAGDAHSDAVMSEKILNDTVTAIRVLAQTHGRNEAWAIRAVTESATLTAPEALKNHVVDVLAPSTEALLQQLEGRVVQVQGRPVTLSFQQAHLEHIEFSTAQQFLSLITHPFVSYLLLMIGFYGLLFEITHPGIMFPGVLGTIALILGLLGMQAMSVNYAGLGLIALALGLFVAEVFFPAFGSLLIGGVISLILGTLLVYQTGDPFLTPLIPALVGASVLLGLVTVWFLRKISKTYHQKSLSPLEKLVGQAATVVAVLPNGSLKVRVHGEIWDAQSPRPCQAEDTVTVQSVDSVKNQLHVD